jgi:hypothetical protein
MRNATLASLVTVLALSAAPAKAEVLSNESIDVDLVFFVPCANGGAGELVQVTGPLHVLTTRTENGNHFSAKSHFNPQGISGVGLTTGETYRGVGVTQAHGGGSLSSGQFTLTTINEFGLIGHGSAPNLFLHFTSHITIDANGDVTSNHGNFNLQCR